MTACSSVPVKPDFPNAPNHLMTKCAELSEAKNDSDKLSDLLETVVSNYGLAHECSIKVEAWIEWHKSQQKLFREIK